MAILLMATFKQQWTQQRDFVLGTTREHSVCQLRAVHIHVHVYYTRVQRSPIGAKPQQALVGWPTLFWTC